MIGKRELNSTASKVHRVVASVCCTLVLLAISGDKSAYAQISSKGDSVAVDFVHAPPRSLPQPGLKLKLEVTVKDGTRDTSNPLNAYLSIDGKLTIIPASAWLNAEDQPTYTIETHAPRTEIVYQFGVETADGQTLRSNRYEIRRPCVPEVANTDVEIPTGRDEEQRILYLLEANRRLDEEIKMLEASLDILTSLNELPILQDK